MNTFTQWLEKHDRKWCPNCGAVDYAVRRTRGAFVIEIVLWFCFVLPGLLYTLWRATSKYDACAKCGLPGPIPLSAPRAQEALRGTEWEGWSVTEGRRA